MKKIKIDPVTRIEGHAYVSIDIDEENKKVLDAILRVRELRGFEKILTGMQVESMPLITGRICGVCPISHHMASVKALEQIFGVIPPPIAESLREIIHLAGEDKNIPNAGYAVGNIKLIFFLFKKSILSR